MKFCRNVNIFIVMLQVAKDKGMGRSLFARMFEWCKSQPKLPSFYHFLDTQYRMHPAIMQWPAQYFYANKVHTHSSTRNQMQKCPLHPYLVLSHEFNQSSQEWVADAVCDISYTNPPNSFLITSAHKMY